MNAFLIAIAIFIVTIILILWKPGRLGIGLIAIGGAILMLVTGGITFSDISTAWITIGNTMLTLAALMVITSILDAAGFFPLFAQPIAKLARGKGRWLLLLMGLIAAGLTTLFSNYGSILIGTPIALETLGVLRFRPKTVLAYVLVTGFMADIASLPWISNNAVNAIAYSPHFVITFDYFQIPFFRYFLVMMPLHFTLLITSVGVLWFYFDAYIPVNYTPHKIKTAVVIRDPLLCNWGFAILGLLLLGNFFPQQSWLIASLVALITLALAGRWGQKTKGVIALSKVIRQLPWQLFLFSLGIYLVVIGLGNSGLVPLLSKVFTIISSWGITLATNGVGFLAMFLSGLMHNLPTVTNNALAIQNADIVNPAIREAMIYANIIGCTIGAKITPIGSLSTLLWLEILQRRGIRLSWSHYLRIYFILILPVMFIGLLFLAIWLPWLIA